jgi:DNA repair exonuclease SbcCD nuclease subunit
VSVPDRVRETVLVHSSDLHIDDGPHIGSYSGLVGLASVLATARSLRADVVLLAGDTFDNHRVSDAVLRQASALIAAAGTRVVLLPGNHDPAMSDCLFRRAGLLNQPHVHVLGITGQDNLVLHEHALEVRGRAHTGFSDMAPFHPPRPRAARWLVVMAHGHYLPAGEWQRQSHRAWKFGDADIAATEADYVALGHWDRATRIGDGHMHAYYSGSPDLAGTVNVIRMGSDGCVSVDRTNLKWDRSARAFRRGSGMSSNPIAQA